jgi:large conductance mechanosensitive channel protein
MSFVKEFKQFALKGNLVDIAVAFVMGGAFGKVVSTSTREVALGFNNFTFERNNLSAGVYFIKVSNGTNASTFKFVIAD